jgi:hypothetical protein
MRKPVSTQMAPAETAMPIMPDCTGMRAGSYHTSEKAHASRTLTVRCRNCRNFIVRANL